MDDLVRWLGVQLDEDQRLAEDALKKTTTTRRRIGGEWVEDTVQPPEWRRSVWGPARVLLEIEAKREVLRLAVRARDYAPTFTSGFAAAMEQALRLYAVAYEGRPGFLEEWRP